MHVCTYIIMYYVFIYDLYTMRYAFKWQCLDEPTLKISMARRREIIFRNSLPHSVTLYSSVTNNITGSVHEKLSWFSWTDPLRELLIYHEKMYGGIYLLVIFYQKWNAFWQQSVYSMHMGVLTKAWRSISKCIEVLTNNNFKTINYNNFSGEDFWTPWTYNKRYGPGASIYRYT